MRSLYAPRLLFFLPPVASSGSPGVREWCGCERGLPLLPV
uniref:Uncharacterized protein n=1 Tax=Setaria viridis TaxID=4556 RepID=A0A4U6VZ20_SETVI|nr:hypothetical protein SEVIR_2G026650v2 [Setaria viridis]